MAALRLRRSERPRWAATQTPAEPAEVRLLRDVIAQESAFFKSAKEHA